MKYILLVSLLLATSAYASEKQDKKMKRDPANYQQVKGHIRSNGTYVAPYIRTTPNGNPYDNIRPRQ